VTVQIADLRDPGALLALNNAAIPDVNRLDATKADWLTAHSVLARVATIGEAAAGVVIVLSETAALESEYFRWFTERYGNFLYIDRVVVASDARRHGIATTLYREVEALASKRAQAIASDVYCSPPNAASLRFHQKLGYVEVGQQFSASETRTVCKLMKFGDRARSRR